MPCRGVELGHEPRWRRGPRPGPGRVLQLQAQVDGLLLEMGDLLAEGIDVSLRAEPGFAPGLLAERLDRRFSSRRTRRLAALSVRGRRAGRLAARRRRRRAGGAAGGGQGSFESVDLAEQVAVPVEEGPVHGGSAGDPVTVISAPSSRAWLSAAMTRCRRRAESLRLPHCLGPRARRPGRGRRGGTGHARASLAGEGAVTRADGMPRDTARCLRITVTASSTWARSAR